MKRFGFDLDGVLYMWHRPAYDYLVYSRGESRTYYQFWKDIIDGKDDYGDLFWENLVRIPTLYSQLSAKESDVATLHDLSKRYDIVYVTHRPEEVRLTTLNWLKRYRFPNADRVYFTNLPKHLAVRKYGCDLYIEDRGDILRSDLRNVVNLIARRTLWNWEECETLPYVDEISELLKLV